MLISKVDDLLLTWNVTFEDVKSSEKGLRTPAKVLHRLVYFVRSIVKFTGF